MKISDICPPGESRELGAYLFTPERIIHFARKFDPQPFHVDAEAARHSLFGGLCASGWHTCAAFMQTWLAFWDAQTQALAGSGDTAPQHSPEPDVQNLRWLKPVFADDVITYKMTVIDSMPHASRPGHVLTRTFNEGINQKGEAVLQFEGSVVEEG